MAYEAPLEGKLTATDLLDLIYPVGSVYMSWSTTSPASFLGGTWTQIQDRFLMAAGSTYTAGSTGGAATQTLSTSNLPVHSHTASGSSGNASADHTHSFSATTGAGGAHGSSIGRTGTLSGAGSTRLTVHDTGLTSVNPATTSAGSLAHSVSGTSGNQSASHTHNWNSFTSGSAGQASPSSFSTLPPYRAVRIWQRTA